MQDVARELPSRMATRVPNRQNARRPKLGPCRKASIAQHAHDIRDSKLLEEILDPCHSEKGASVASHVVNFRPKPNNHARRRLLIPHVLLCTWYRDYKSMEGDFPSPKLVPYTWQARTATNEACLQLNKKQNCKYDPQTRSSSQP